MEDKPVKPVTTNKNGRPRKVLDENALQKLAQAREIARKMANERTIEKTQAKLEKEKSKFKPEEEAKEEVEPVKEENPVDLIEDEKPLDNEVVESEETEVKPVKKEKKKVNKKQPKVIVEQSSDDSDEFEENNRVIFVKRVSRKKKEEKKEIKEEIQKVDLPQYPGSPERRRPPPEPRMTREQAQFQNSYNSMFSGGFLNNNNMRRRY
tara:strand:- start:50 stop:673 length:624 start_codon:yes stop_codon:yes gene_type:complete